MQQGLKFGSDLTMAEKKESFFKKISKSKVGCDRNLAYLHNINNGQTPSGRLPLREFEDMAPRAARGL